MRNKIFKIIGIIALFLLLGVSVLCEAIISPVSAIEGARASIVMEANFKKVLYEDNIHMRLPMASTTKITTAIVAIENYPELDHEFEVNPSAIGIEGTSIYLKQNEKMTMRELLLGLMLASGNDCAVAIACEVAGSEAKFVDMMNDFVVDKLGLSDTHYDNPHGLDSDTHYTSAYDLAYITSYALDNPIFCEIVGTKNATIRGNDEVEARYLKHKNRLLFTDTNCIGVKTGFTDNAGRCLVHATKKDNMTLVSVVLNCPDMFNACDALDRVARDEYVCHTLLEPYTIIGYHSVRHLVVTREL